VIQAVRGLGDLIVGDGGEVVFLGEVLTDQPVGVFV